MSLAENFRSNWLIATFGCILFSVGISILFWNEGRAVHIILSLDEALDNAITVNPEEDIPQHYENRIVHIRGPLIIGEPLTEPDYNIQILSVKLKRRVQMYQWIEETVEHNYGQSAGQMHTEDRTYYYTTEWKDKLIDSGQFYIRYGHENPDRFPIESQIQTADIVNIGKFELGKDVKDKFTNFIELTSDTRPEDPSIKLHLGLYYHCNDIFNPQVGDLRILFSFAGMEGEMYTIVGRLRKGKIIPYTKNRRAKVLLVYPGELSLEEVFKREHHAQRLTTWGFRFMGWVLIFFGATCTASLLHAIIMKIYFFASFAPDPNYPVPMNFVISLSMALIIISFSWFFHRPWLGGGLLFAALSPFFYLARGFIHYHRV